MDDDCRGNKDCPFRHLIPLFDAISSGKAQISWNGKVVRHYEHIETDTKEDLKD